MVSLSLQATNTTLATQGLNLTVLSGDMQTFLVISQQVNVARRVGSYFWCHSLAFPWQSIPRLGLSWLWRQNTIRWSSPTVIHWLHPETQLILISVRADNLLDIPLRTVALYNSHLVGGLGSGIFETTILVLTHSLSFNRREIIIAIINITLFSTVGAGINVILQPLQFTVLSPTPPPCSPCVITLPPT